MNGVNDQVYSLINQNIISSIFEMETSMTQ